MNLFRLLLAVMLVTVVIYTGATAASHGLNLLPVFFGDIAKGAWPGQFDLDFMSMLALSALWVAWRNRFSPLGLGLAVVAFFGGTPFLSLYLLILSLRARGGIGESLLGKDRGDTRA